MICIAFVAFIDRRPKWLAFWVVIAAGFHASAMVFLLLIPLAVGHYTKSKLAIAALLAIPGLILLSSGESAEITIGRHVGAGAEAFGALFRLGILGLSALYFFRFIQKKWMQAYPEDYSVVSMGAIGMALALLLLPISSVIGDRFGYYLIPIQAMIFARIPYLPFKSEHTFHSALPYLVLLIVFLVWAQMSWLFQLCYIPYSSWILGLPDGDILK